MWKGLSVVHFHKPRSVSVETRQHPPEPFCTHMDRDPYEGAPESRVWERTWLRAGPGAPLSLSFHWLSSPSLCSHRFVWSFLRNYPYILLPTLANLPGPKCHCRLNSFLIPNHFRCFWFLVLVGSANCDS